MLTYHLWSLLAFTRGLFQRENDYKTPSEVFCSNRIPLEIAQADTLSSTDEWFLHWRFLRAPGWTEYWIHVVFSFIPWFLEFIFSQGTIPALISLFNLGFSPELTLLDCTFELFHLQTTTLYPGNHNDNDMWPVSYSMTSQWGYVTNQILKLSGWAKLEEIKLTDLTIFGLDIWS